jgi:hypothetical protein
MKGGMPDLPIAIQRANEIVDNMHLIDPNHLYCVSNIDINFRKGNLTS